MPIPKRRLVPSSNGHAANGDGKLSKFAAVLASRRSGTDDIVIAPDSPVPGEELDVQAGSMADVMKRVDGIKYLVKDWVPYQLATMLVGEPGAGKSAFALYGLCRPVLMGCDWFNGMKGPSKPGNVLWCDTEGTAAITVDRIKKWRLPAERIKVPFDDDPLMSINLMWSHHVEQVAAVIAKYQIKLVVIDSLRGAHDGDENNSRVQQVLQNVATIAEETRAAVVIIHHTRKLMVDEQITANSSRGSNAILAMVRSQLGVDSPDKTSKWCRLQMLKENLGLKPQPIGFLVTDTGLEFGQAPERARKETAKDRAEQFLLDSMTQGQWYAAAELIEDAKQQGISEDALHRAKTELGIVKPECLKKEKDGWMWKLPAGKAAARP